MSIRSIFGNNKPAEPKPEEDKKDNRIEGKIIHLGSGGWGFITSESMPYTRIFFHWTTLEGNTLRFPDLKKGMRVLFMPQLRDDGTYRALKIRVIEETKSE
jgi:cold shock CspA family protein